MRYDEFSSLYPPSNNESMCRRGPYLRGARSRSLTLSRSRSFRAEKIRLSPEVQAKCRAVQPWSSRALMDCRDVCRRDETVLKSWFHTA